MLHSLFCIFPFRIVIPLISRMTLHLTTTAASRSKGDGHTVREGQSEGEGKGLQEVTFVAAGGLLFSGCRTWGHLHLVYPHNASPFSSSNIIFSLGFFFRLVWLASPKQQQQQSRVYALRHYGETLNLSLGGFILLSFGNSNRFRYEATFYDKYFKNNKIILIFIWLWDIVMFFRQFTSYFSTFIYIAYQTYVYSVINYLPSMHSS